MEAWLLLCGFTLLLAWVNGANDIAKGVATLVGAHPQRMRQAVWWGSACTVIGGLAASIWGAAMVKTFSSGFLVPGFSINLAFLISAILGAVFWLLIATWRGLPVSTTHALLGGIVGAAIAAVGTEALLLSAVLKKALLPLLLSPLIAIAACALILLAARALSKRVPAWQAGCCDIADWRHNPYLCREHPKQATRRAEYIWLGLHWLSSGVTCFARALNDVPKIAAFLLLTFGLAPALVVAPHSVWAFALVTGAMALGSLWGGFRVLAVMAHRIVPLDASRALSANVGTSLLVLAASPLGLPVSTTHVSTGALMGVRWLDRLRPDSGDALMMILFGWLVTLPVAALVALASGTFLQGTL